jgi:cation/acetate symporter
LQHRSSRIDGLAIFAAAAFAVGIVAIDALARVGAPDGVVRALGPVFVLFGLTIVGLGARNADLPSFMAARRRLPALYGALNVAAVAAGIALCLGSPSASGADPPWLGVFAGIGLGAAGYGPVVRRFGATSVTDVIATRFSRSPARLFSAAAIWTAAALTALAGYRVAVAEVQALIAPNPAIAEAIVAIVLALGAAPGGLAGVVWCAAASAGALTMIVGLGGVAGWELGMAPPDPYAALASALAGLSTPDSLVAGLAAAIAAAGFFALEPPSIASPDVPTAAKAGLGGFFLCLVLAAAASAANSVFPIDAKAATADPVAVSLIGAAALGGSLALARVGVHMSSRAFGAALADRPARHPTLASVRLARMRAAQLAVVAGCIAFDRQGFLSSRAALLGAMALSLTFTTPIVALAAIGRAGPAAASGGAVAALAATVYFFAASSTGLPPAGGLFERALAAAAAAFVAGSLICLALPRRGPPPTPGPFDPFDGVSG